MKHCNVCHRPINRGATASSGRNATCLACLAARALAGWAWKGKK